MPTLVANENRPDYKHPDYQKLESRLKVMQDVFNGLEGVKKEYLPKGEKEHDKVYSQRVDRSVFNNKLRSTVESNAGLLTAFEVSGEPPSLKDAEKNVDLRGSDLKAFFQEADTKALTDGVCYVYVDYPPVQFGETAADQRGRRPHLTLIDRRNVLNWRTAIVDGKPTVTQVVFVMVSEREEGLFGCKRVPQYHQLWRSPEGVRHQIWEITEKNEATKIGEERVVQGLQEIPLVPYPFVSDPFPTDNPPLLKMARLNVELFQLDSLRKEIAYRLCPTLIRKHPGPVPDQSELPPVILGASYLLEAPGGGDVTVLSIPPDLIAPINELMAELLMAIEGESLAFLAGSTVQRTATESFLSSAQIQASLNGYARAKSGAIARCVQFWVMYTGESADKFEVSMDQSVLEQPLDAGETSTIKDLWKELMIDRRTALELLKMGRQLPPNADIDEIMKRVDEERAKESEAQALADPFGLGDNGGMMQPMEAA